MQRKYDELEEHYSLMNRKKEILESLLTIEEQRQYMTGKILDEKRPHYNSYVTVFGRDLNVWMLEVELLLKLLTFDHLEKMKETEK